MARSTLHVVAADSNSRESRLRKRYESQYKDDALLHDKALQVQKGALAMQKKSKDQKRKEEGKNKARRSSRDIVVPKPQFGLASEDVVLFREEDGTPLYGAFGLGKPAWWALSIKRGQQKQLLKAVNLVLSSQTESDVTTDVSSSILDSRVPEKRVNMWSPKYKEMKMAVVKYDDGGWLLIRATLDNALFDILNNDMHFIAFRHFKTIQGLQFPIPCPEDEFERIEEWLADDQPLSTSAVLGKSKPQQEDLLGISDGDLRAYGQTTESYMQDLLQRFSEEDAEKSSGALKKRRKESLRPGRSRERPHSSGPERPRYQGTNRRQHFGQSKMSSSYGWHDGSREGSGGWYEAATERDSELSAGWLGSDKAPPTTEDDDDDDDELSWWDEGISDDVNSEEKKHAFGSPGEEKGSGVRRRQGGREPSPREGGDEMAMPWDSAEEDSLEWDV